MPELTAERKKPSYDRVFLKITSHLACYFLYACEFTQRHLNSGSSNPCTFKISRVFSYKQKNCLKLKNENEDSAKCN